MIYKKKRTISIFNDKRGIAHELFFNIFELVLAAIVLLALLYFINDVAAQTIFEKNYMARDLAALTNKIYAAPGEVTYNYNENVQDFKFDFVGNKIEVSGVQDKDSTNVFYLFAKNTNMPMADKTLEYKKENIHIKFSKSSDAISVGNSNLS